MTEKSAAELLKEAKQAIALAIDYCKNPMLARAAYEAVDHAVESARGEERARTLAEARDKFFECCESQDMGQFENEIGKMINIFDAKRKGRDG